MKPLFNIRMNAGLHSALAIRSDVDICIWVPQSNKDEWAIKHKGTLNAMGYIQASKQQKKYMQCAPDMSYSVICESHRHVFFYLSQNSLATGLKNRNGIPVSIGQQKLLTMLPGNEIIGIIVENDLTFLLTETEIICIQVNT